MPRLNRSSFKPKQLSFLLILIFVVGEFFVNPERICFTPFFQTMVFLVWVGSIASALVCQFFTAFSLMIGFEGLFAQL
jgi:hypothetical protein